MQLSATFEYTLKLNAIEMRLINAGLRGSLREEQKPEALELSNRIAEARVAQGKHLWEEMQKLERNLVKGE